MPFTPEVDAWFKELELTPEEISTLEPVFGKPERIEKVKGSVLRQAEFSRRMQALDKQKQDLEAAIAEKERLVAEDAAKLGSWKQTADQTLSTTSKALEDERVKHFRLQQKMQALATQYGVDPNDLGLETPVPPEKKEPFADLSELDKKYYGKEDAERLMNEVKASPFIAAELEDIVDEHRSLFGKGINRRELVMSALKNKRNLREEWEEQNKVSDRRRELEEKKIEERINARVAEEKTKILSEHKLPVTRGSESGSPILSMRDNLRLAGTDRSKPAQESSAVEAAVAAFNSGKYKPEKTA
jgi:hypothetical protein